MSSSKSKWIWLSVPLGALSWSVGSPVSLIAVSVFSPVSVVFCRCLLAAVILAALLNKKIPRIFFKLPRSAKRYLVAAGILLAAHFSFFVASLAHTSFAAAICLVALEPIVILLAGALFFKIRPTATQVIGIIVAIAGATLLSFSGSEEINTNVNTLANRPHSLWGDALMIIAVLLYSAYFTVNRKLEKHIPEGATWAFSAVIYLVAAATAGLYLLVSGAPMVIGQLSWGAIGAVVVLGLVPTLVGHSLCQIASRNLAPVWVAIMSPAETLGALGIGIAFLGTKPHSGELWGGFFILCGALVATLGSARDLSSKKNMIPLQDG